MSKSAWSWQVHVFQAVGVHVHLVLPLLVSCCVLTWGTFVIMGCEWNIFHVTVCVTFLKKLAFATIQWSIFAACFCVAISVVLGAHFCSVLAVTLSVPFSEWCLCFVWVSQGTLGKVCCVSQRNSTKWRETSRLSPLCIFYPIQYFFTIYNSNAFYTFLSWVRHFIFHIWLFKGVS